jgi:sugar fermentation stimulation protein A
MRYERMKKAVFLERPNRFVARIELEGEEVLCHVKNTGRCRELLIPGTTVWVQEAAGGTRKTKYDLISVQKDGEFINLDSQIPNRVVEEWIEKKGLFPDLTFLKAEQRFQDSRFDFYLEAGEKKAFLEVKGVTLKEGKRALFPDAPTERGLKHLRELTAACEEGYEAYLIFLIQMKGVSELEPNDRTQPAFREAMREAWGKGVRILAYDSIVTEDTITLDQEVAVIL